MPYPQIKRNRYTDDSGFVPPHSSLNHAEDMQDFHLPGAEARNASFHTWGVARGLEVSGTLGTGTEVVIQPGVAIDELGRMIVLADDGHGDIGANPPGGQHNEVTVPVTLGFGSHTGPVYVTIQYSEILRDSEGAFGRLELAPWIQIEPVSGDDAYVHDGEAVILAVAEIDATTGALVDLQPARSDFNHGRRVIGQSIGSVEIRRAGRAGDSVEEIAAARIGPGADGGLNIMVANPADGVTIGAEGGDNLADLTMRADTVTTTDAAGREAMRLDSGDARLTIGAEGNEGDLSIRDGAGRQAVQMDGATAVLYIGTTANAGDIIVRDNAERQVMHLDGAGAAIFIGAAGNDGNIFIRDGANRQVINLDSSSGSIQLGTTGNSGNIYVRDASNRQVMMFDGTSAVLQIGTTGNGGDILVTDTAGRQVMRFNADGAHLVLGSTGNSGDIYVVDNAGRSSAIINGAGGSLTLGTNDNSGEVFVRNSSGVVRGYLGGDGRLRTERIQPYGNTLHIDARYLKVHAWDLCLDGRSGGNKRALVDDNNRLVINWANDYSKGIYTPGSLRVDGGFNASRHVRLYSYNFWAFAWNVGTKYHYRWLNHASRNDYSVHLWYAVNTLSYGENATQGGKYTLKISQTTTDKSRVRLSVNNISVDVTFYALCVRK